MDLQTYFIKVVQSGLYRHFDNMVALFVITKLDQLKKLPYTLGSRDGFYFYYDENLEEKQFSKRISTEDPLFKYLDKITVNPGDLENVVKTIETTYGNVYVNAIISHVAGNAIPFVIGNIGKSLGDLEQLIADIMVDDPPEGEKVPPGRISVSQHIQVMSDLQTLEELSTLVVTAATERNIMAPEGIDEFKAQLLKKYEGQLDDPIIQVQIVKELQAFDEEWLKDDPSNNIIVSGKIKKVARTKSFLAAGNAPNFNAEMSSNFRMQSFSDGAETDPAQLAIINSSIRYGSYGRGTLTAEAGTIAKAMMQIFSSLTVEDRDCGTKITRSITLSGTRNQYIGRYQKVASGLELITKDNIDGLMGKTIEVRSPSYCKEEATEVCRFCAGENLFRFRESLTQAGTDLANIIIYKVYFALIKGAEVVSTTIREDDLFK